MSNQVFNQASSALGTKARCRRWSARCRCELSEIIKKIHILKLIVGHPLTPLGAKAVGISALAYLLSPIQLIPTFIPVIGQLDDLVVVLMGMALVRKLTPATILRECEERAAAKTFVFRSARGHKESYVASTDGSL